MPIRLAPAPPDAASKVRNAAASLIAQPPSVHALAKAAPVDLSDLHPVYAATAQDVLDGTVLAAAQLIGWRVIVSKDGQPLAAVESDASVNEGPFVAGTVEAVTAAEEKFAADARDYELRLLRIPAVYAIAIWLHANDADVLIPVAPAPASLRANEPLGEAAFTEALRPQAAKQLT